MQSKNRGLFVLLFFLTLASLLLVLFNVLIFSFIPSLRQSVEHFSYLASAFLAGHLYLDSFISVIGKYDTAYFNGHYYWPLGPGPAVLLLPFVYLFSLLKIFFWQAYLSLALVALNFFLVFRISRRFNYQVLDALYLAYAFIFASVFIGPAAFPWSWYFAQTVAVAMLVLSLNEFFHRRRYWLIGIFLAFALTVRITAGLGVVFFVLMILFSERHQSGGKVKQLAQLAQLAFPLSVAFLGLAIYNYWRFNSFLNSGYGLQIIHESQAILRNQGLFSWRHLGRNFYEAFLHLPILNRSYPYIQASPWGLSLFISTPYLVYLFFWKYRDKLSKFLWATIVVIAIPIFLYYGIGFRQFSYRYALDFFPFLFVLFIYNFRKRYNSLGMGLKALIIISSLLNFYLAYTVFVRI